jgi:hypothetical protein
MSARSRSFRALTLRRTHDVDVSLALAPLVFATLHRLVA